MVTNHQTHSQPSSLSSSTPVLTVLTDVLQAVEMTTILSCYLACLAVPLTPILVGIFQAAQATMSSSHCTRIFIPRAPVLMGVLRPPWRATYVGPNHVPLRTKGSNGRPTCGRRLGVPEGHMIRPNVRSPRGRAEYPSTVGGRLILGPEDPRVPV